MQIFAAMVMAGTDGHTGPVVDRDVCELSKKISNIVDVVMEWCIRGT